jgi:hypothetical protein
MKRPEPGSIIPPLNRWEGFIPIGEFWKSACLACIMKHHFINKIIALVLGCFIGFCIFDLLLNQTPKMTQ